MQVKPLRRYRKPSYPLSIDIIADPTILRQNIPANWLKNQTICKFIGLALAANSSLVGCVTADEAIPIKPSGRVDVVHAQDVDAQDTIDGQIAADDQDGGRLAEPLPPADKDAGPDIVAKAIAPLFKHGDGRASFGCNSVVPPVYLSEDEAIEVMIGAVENTNLNLQKNVSHEDINIQTLHVLDDCDDDLKTSCVGKFKTSSSGFRLRGLFRCT